MALHSCLIDSNILLRAALRDNPEHVLVRSALTKPISAETVLYFTHLRTSLNFGMPPPASKNLSKNCGWYLVCPMLLRRYFLA
jgi:hypothetical protein